MKDLKLDTEQQKLMEFLITTWRHLRIYGLPPGVPPNRLEILRDAFAKTFNSPDFEKDAERQGIIVSPSSWEKINADMKQLSQTSPKTLKLYRKLTGLK